MVWKDLLNKMQTCAELLYQNREQEAYDMLNSLLMPLNETLQRMAELSSEMNVQEILKVIEAFLNAYQVKDNLAMADILYYCIPEKAEEIGIWN